MLVAHTLSWGFYFIFLIFFPFEPNFFLILKIAQGKRLTFNMYVVATRNGKNYDFHPTCIQGSFGVDG
jgi:hypothetical protein